MHLCAQEDDLHEAFSEFGELKNIYMNLDRQTGFVKGYALIEYKTKKEAQAAIDAMNGAELLTQQITVDYAFKKVGGWGWQCCWQRQTSHAAVNGCTWLWCLMQACCGTGCARPPDQCQCQCLRASPTHPSCRGTSSEVAQAWGGAGGAERVRGERM